MAEEFKVENKHRITVPQLDVPPRLLLGPGPSNAHPRVLQALCTHQIGHLDPKFLQLMNETQELLRYAFQTDNAVTVPVSGTGSAAMESTFANLVEPNDTVLIFVAGYFSERMVDMAGRYGGNVVRVDKPWGSLFTEEEIKAAIEEHRPAVVGIVHADTSTGALQPVHFISALCAPHNALLIVDTVTSLAGCPLFVDKWGIDACYSGAQKNLNCPPGISPLTVSARAMAKVAARRGKVPNWYLDWSMVGKYWGQDRTYHHTAPISMNFALREALRVVAEEGLEERWRRHKQTAELLYQELHRIGLSCFIEDPHNRIPSLTTVRVPDGVDAKAVSAFLLQHYNIEIGNGMGQLAGRVWRIGLMGYNSRPENVKIVVTALQDALQQLRGQRQ